MDIGIVPDKKSALVVGCAKGNVDGGMNLSVCVCSDTQWVEALHSHYCIIDHFLRIHLFFMSF